VRDALQTYIKRHNPTFSFDSQSPTHRKYVEIYRNAPTGKKLIGLIDVLLVWTSDNIVFSRRRAIGNMLDLCTDMTDGRLSEQGLRDYFNSYFRLDTESNDQLDAIVRDSTNINTWLRLFTTYELTDDPTVQRDVLKDEKEIAAIAALCDRYRESFHANIGLEWATLVAKLLSETFSDKDVDSQFSFVSSEIGEYADLDADELFENTLAFLGSASDDAKDAFGAAVVKHVPRRALQTYRTINDVVTLTYLVGEADKRLKSKWTRRSDQ
jgi:ATP-dependent DNA helicase RecQ